MHAQRFAGAHACVMHGHMRTQKCASRDVFIHIYIQTLGQIERHTYAHAHTCAHVHVHTHARTHTYTQSMFNS